MAAPVDAGRIGTNVTTAAATWTISLPSTISAGETLLIGLRTGAGAVVTGGDLNTSWTQLASNAGDASDDTVYIYGKIASGSEGASDTVTFSASQKGFALAWRITGADSNLSNIFVGSGEFFTAANFDPASQTLPATDDWLGLSFISLAGETQTFTEPTAWANLVSGNSGTGGAAATNCRGAGATFALTSASALNPGAWTHGAPNAGGTHYTLALRPAGTQITPASLTRTRAQGSLTVSPQLKPGALTRTRAQGAVTVNPKLFPGAIARTRALGTPNVIQTISPAALVRTRAQGSPTVSPQLLPGALVRTRTLGTPNVIQIVQPGAITRTRALGTITVSTGATLSPASLVRTRAQGSPAVNVSLAVAALVRSRALGTPTVSPQVVVSALTRTRALGNPSIVLAPTSLSRTRVLNSPTVHPTLVIPALVRTRAQGTPLMQVILSPAALVRTRALGSPTVASVTLLSPASLVRARALGATVVHPYALPGTLVRARNLGSPSVNPTLKPQGLERTRVISLISVDDGLPDGGAPYRTDHHIPEHS